MKKVWIIILVLALLCGCAVEPLGAPAEEAEAAQPVEAPEEAVAVKTELPQLEETEEEAEPTKAAQQQEPGALTVVCGDTSITAAGGTYSWHYTNDDGTSSGIEACGVHPLDAQEYLPALAATGVEAQLQFDGAEPDAVSVRCWSTEQWGNTDAQGAATTVAGLAFPLKSETCVYEVVATWSRFDTWGGTAYYAFYTENG